MLKKHSVLTGIAISLILLVIATSVYPGGSIYASNSIGFAWTGNFISNLFASRALNGAENPSRIWACLGLIILAFSYAIFFINMSKKIPDKNARYILKYGGVANILSMLLVATPLHDLMLNISIALFWTCIVVITVFIFKTKLLLFKICCIICLLCFYYGIYLWAISDWSLLPTMQKINLVNPTLLILGLEYFTRKEDFAHIKPRRQLKEEAENS